MRYFINNRTGGLTCTEDAVEAERLMTVGFREIDKDTYAVEYKWAWDIATGNWQWLSIDSQCLRLAARRDTHTVREIQ